MTGTGKGKAFDHAPDSGTFENSFTISAKGSKEFWACTRAEAAVPAKVTATDCTVGEPQD